MMEGVECARAELELQQLQHPNCCWPFGGQLLAWPCERACVTDCMCVGAPKRGRGAGGGGGTAALVVAAGAQAVMLLKLSVKTATVRKARK